MNKNESDTDESFIILNTIFHNIFKNECNICPLKKYKLPNEIYSI